MGCCSLLAIAQVKAVDPQDRSDLDYGASSEQPQVHEVGCGFSYLTSVDPFAGLLQQQREADDDPNSKAFRDPEAVAANYLRARLAMDSSVAVTLKETSRTSSSAVFEWTQSDKKDGYMVVVSRPYLLSFYARDPNRVAWAIVAAYATSCDEADTVTRIK